VLSTARESCDECVAECRVEWSVVSDYIATLHFDPSCFDHYSATAADSSSFWTESATTSLDFHRGGDRNFCLGIRTFRECGWPSLGLGVGLPTALTKSLDMHDTITISATRRVCRCQLRPPSAAPGLPVATWTNN